MYVCKSKRDTKNAFAQLELMDYLGAERKIIFDLDNPSEARKAKKVLRPKGIRRRGSRKKKSSKPSKSFHQRSLSALFSGNKKKTSRKKHTAPEDDTQGPKEQKKLTKKTTKKKLTAKEPSPKERLNKKKLTKKTSSKKKSAEKTLTKKTLAEKEPIKTKNTGLKFKPKVPSPIQNKEKKKESKTQKPQKITNKAKEKIKSPTHKEKVENLSEKKKPKTAEPKEKPEENREKKKSERAQKSKKTGKSRIQDSQSSITEKIEVETKKPEDSALEVKRERALEKFGDGGELEVECPFCSNIVYFEYQDIDEEDPRSTRLCACDAILRLSIRDYHPKFFSDLQEMGFENTKKTKRKNTTVQDEYGNFIRVHGFQIE